MLVPDFAPLPQHHLKLGAGTKSVLLLDSKIKLRGSAHLDRAVTVLLCLRRFLPSFKSLHAFRTVFFIYNCDCFVNVSNVLITPFTIFLAWFCFVPTCLIIKYILFSVRIILVFFVVFFCV